MKKTVIIFLIMGAVIILIWSRINMKSEKQLENFYRLKFGMTRSEVISIVGEPDGEMGSGIIRPFYILNDGSYVILTYGPTSKSQVDAILHRVEYQNKQGNIITIDIN